MRPFHLRDLTALYSYRDQIIGLDCANDLTRGSSVLGASFFLDQLDPERGAYLAVKDDDYYQQKIIGQLIKDNDRTCAHLNALMPTSLGGTSAMGEVIGALCQHATDWGALGVMADVEVGGAVFPIMRKQGFQVYDRLRIWMIEPRTNYRRNANCGWEVYEDIDQIAIRHLFYSLIPPLSQAAQFRNFNNIRGMVYWQEGEILGFVESSVGTQGIFLTPLIHPAVENVSSVLYAAIHHFAPLLGRSVYIAIPSYMGWLESTLYDLNGEVVSLRTQMVRYLAQPLRVKESESLLRPLERVPIHPSHFEPRG